MLITMYDENGRLVGAGLSGSTDLVKSLQGEPGSTFAAARRRRVPKVKATKADGDFGRPEDRTVPATKATKPAPRQTSRAPLTKSLSPEQRAAFNKRAAALRAARRAEFFGKALEAAEDVRRADVARAARFLGLPLADFL